MILITDGYTSVSYTHLFNWGNDGWVSDGDGVKVLKIFARSSAVIDYQPFAVEAARRGKTCLLYTSNTFTELVNSTSVQSSYKSLIDWLTGAISSAAENICLLYTSLTCPGN